MKIVIEAFIALKDENKPNSSHGRNQVKRIRKIYEMVGQNL